MASTNWKEVILAVEATVKTKQKETSPTATVDVVVAVAFAFAVAVAVTDTSRIGDHDNSEFIEIPPLATLGIIISS